MANVKIGDRVRIVNAVTYGDFGYCNGEEYEIKGFTGSRPDIWPDGTEDSAIYLNEEEYVIIEAEGDRVKTTAELLAERRKEVAELEAKLHGEIIGSIAIVTNLGYHGDIPVGTVVKVTEYDEDYDEQPYKAELLDGSDFDRFELDDLKVATYETAQAYLIAEVDRQLAEAFRRGGDAA